MQCQSDSGSLKFKQNKICSGECCILVKLDPVGTSLVDSV